MWHVYGFSLLILSCYYSCGPSQWYKKKFISLDYGLEKNECIVFENYSLHIDEICGSLELYFRGYIFIVFSLHIESIIAHSGNICNKNVEIW